MSIRPYTEKEYLPKSAENADNFENPIQHACAQYNKIYVYILERE